ncbi:hypothetical protein Tcan_13696 [Toxocara canis]|uniref:Uncharacterized protein n=1 Tax=Toxocara canis TaxID=6265 RepID=A0A0B2VCH4_TOXCA|nr:hypothetical protein Tcan_13696 [Toxocara canis]
MLTVACFHFFISVFLQSDEQSVDTFIWDICESICCKQTILYAWSSALAIGSMVFVLNSCCQKKNAAASTSDLKQIAQFQQPTVTDQEDLTSDKLIIGKRHKKTKHRKKHKKKDRKYPPKDLQEDNESYPKPRKFVKGPKEKLIAKGCRAGQQEYKTMDDVASDWGSESDDREEREVREKTSNATSTRGIQSVFLN